MTPKSLGVVLAEPLLASYVQLADGLIGAVAGVSVFDGQLRSRGTTDGCGPLLDWLTQLHWTRVGERVPAATATGRGLWATAIPVEQSDGSLLGVFCVHQRREPPPAQPSSYAREVARGLKPLLDCMHRELAAAIPVRSRIQTMIERTAEIEWLFRVTGTLKGSGDERNVLEELLDAAAQRLGSALGVIYIPGKRLCVNRSQSAAHRDSLLKTWEASKPHLLTWAQRHNRPLVMGAANADGRRARCNILSVPVTRESGQVIGVLAFLKPPSDPPCDSRHVFLARHLARQAAGIVESQFDLMTGLYTRGGLDQASGHLSSGAQCEDRCLLHIDVDHMQLVNELQGFELGNEVIVRIADLLAPPLLPDGSLAARISADRFAILLPTADGAAAAATAETIRAAAKRLSVGPAENGIDISISCGIATFISMPQGLDRALAMAELACKAAKKKGGDRVEVYACDDHSMIRRHDDLVAVGKLRAALKADRLVLYAQPIVPLRSSTLPWGYEILLRMIDHDGTLVTPGPLITAAQRYQLLPTVDRWVTQRALDMLAPYRGMLSSRGIGISLNVSGQSIGDENFVEQLVRQIRAARLPADCITVEITEQSAVTNLARANGLIRRLRAVGCQIALDDFGTGANSLAYLKNLQITRVKIDGSFVRDVATDRNSRATVRAIVELAAGMSIDTVAEYVETQAIATELRSLGVDYAQGYAYGRPAPLQGVLDALAGAESQQANNLFLET